MNKKHYTKRIFSLLIVCTLLVTLTGCYGNQADMSLNEDGTCSVTLRFLYENDYYDLIQLIKSDSSSSSTEESEPEYAIESGDFTEGSLAYGQFNYHCFSREFSFATYDELKNFLSDRNSYINGLKQNSKNPTIYDKVEDALLKDVTLTSTLFKAALNDSIDDIENAISKKGELVKGGSDSSSSDWDNLSLAESLQNELGFRIDFSITMPNSIIASNGKVSGNTVTWDLASMSADGTMIADAGAGYFTSDTTPPVIKGVKNGALIRKKTTITATDDVCLQSISLNGKTLNGVRGVTLGNETFNDGKYTFTATDAAGNHSTVKVTVDQTKPTIKGAKNNKTYKKKVTLRFKDKNGIKKITINGKTIKKTTKSKTLRKRGKYTVKVTDKAGNQNKIKFRIK